MILSDIRRYLSENRIVTLKDLSVHFDIEPDAMQGME
jgi:FeoC like transcriptional regulator